MLRILISEILTDALPRQPRPHRHRCSSRYCGSSLLHRLAPAPLLRFRCWTGLGCRRWPVSLGLPRCSCPGCRRWPIASRFRLASGRPRRLFGGGDFAWGFRAGFRWCPDGSSEAHIVILMFGRFRYGMGARNGACQRDDEACEWPETGSSTRIAVQWSVFLQDRSRAGYRPQRGDAREFSATPGSRARRPRETVVQWLVPSDLLILFHTLYFPTGFLAGMRLTSRRFLASITSSAPSISQRLARA